MESTVTLSPPQPVQADDPVERLVRAALAGQPRAYEFLVGRYFGMVYAIGLAHLSDRDLAQDLTQEVFLRAYLFLDRLHNPDKFPGWITRMARNLASEWQRSGALRRCIAPMVPLDESHAEIPDTRTNGVLDRMETDESARLLHETLQMLPADQREVILLHYMEDLTQDEIADRLGVHRSSVSRALARALKRMRGLLAPTLHQVMPRLRAPQSAAIRTATMAGIVAGLAASQKAALAAASGMTAASIEAQGAASAGAGLSSVVNVFAAIISSGGTVMGSGKIIAISAAAVVAVGGGAYYVSQESGTTPTRPVATAAVPEALPGESIIPPASTTPPRKYKDWNEYAAGYLAQNPGNTGFAQLLQALNAVDVKQPGLAKPFLDPVLTNGASAMSPQLNAAIQANTNALTGAFAAAQTAPFDMPQPIDFTTPVPNFLATQQLVKMMAVTARMSEKNGDLNDAVQRAVAGLRLSESYRGRGGFLISHLIGIATSTTSAKVLASILRNPALPPETAGWVLKSLQDLETKRNGIGEGLRGEGHCNIASVRLMKDDPATRKTLDPENRMKVDSIASMPEFEKEFDRIFRTMIANLEKPYYQRQKMDANFLKGLTSNPDLLVMLPNFEEAYVRSETALAYLRLCETLAALRSTTPDAAKSIADPFANRPITVAPDKAYSLGPDMKDQQGTLLYDPTNGTVSEGDVVFLR